MLNKGSVVYIIIFAVIYFVANFTSYIFIKNTRRQWPKLFSYTIHIYTWSGNYIIYPLYHTFLKSTDGNTLLCNKIERPDDKVISYIFTYITPIISVDISRFSTIIANVLLFLMVLFLYIRLDLFYINPVLIFIGYIPYKVDDKMLISDMTFSKIKRFKRELRGYYITNEIFVAKSKYNKTI